MPGAKTDTSKGEAMKVRTTIQPELELEVSEQEFTDLTALGIVLDTSATTPEGIRRAAEKQVANHQENSK